MNWQQAVECIRVLAHEAMDIRNFVRASALFAEMNEILEDPDSGKKIYCWKTS